ncbi:hypothetical protein IDJ79_05370 [Candidatus Liberibacter asiaticus]|uniref:Uncharacterized protein n=1 Tax=Liberibacter phage SGCA5-1 TaxID=1903184 RepID=A0A1L2JXW4_9CAUD|nr:cell envelope integrity protein TolA [Candidatus Liberibacter asiaticus]APC45988.1 hypothetical protein PSGCA5_07 [Liberibacter phage SGCA5-1]KAE9518114.1 hypothetical protein FXW28_05440 [Candidatus Liberibacter asiaticus]KRF68325.1 hypothetical protein AQ620_05255 [Candidatus Liberibacter asiaticus]UKY34142.1 hypothetical protein IDJ79_05370 [Candidatus Liberibacter asiaticus]
MGFWNSITSIAATVGAGLATVATAAALATPIGWVGAAVAGVGAAVVGAGASDLAMHKMREQEEEEKKASEKRIKEETEKLLISKDPEVLERLRVMNELATSIDYQTNNLDQDKIPSEDVAKTITSIQDNIKHLREFIIAWSSDLNPHKDRYDYIVGPIEQRLKKVSERYERVVSRDLTLVIEAGLKDLKEVGDTLKRLAETGEVILSDKSDRLLYRFMDIVETKDEHKINKQVRDALESAGFDLESTQENIRKVESALINNNMKDAFRFLELAQKSKETADSHIIEAIDVGTKLKENTPPNTFTSISKVLLKSNNMQDVVFTKIKEVVKKHVNAELGHRKLRGLAFDHTYFNDKLNQFLKEIKNHQKEYDESEKGSSKARYHAAYAHIYWDLANDWVNGRVGDKSDEWARTSTNIASWIGRITRTEGLGGVTYDQIKQLRDLASKVKADYHWAEIRHGNRFKAETRLAYSTIANVANFTSELKQATVLARANAQEEKQRREQEAKEKADREKADKEAKEKADREKADKELQEKTPIKAEGDDFGLGLPSVPTHSVKLPPKEEELEEVKEEAEPAKDEGKKGKEPGTTETDDREETERKNQDILDNSLLAGKTHTKNETPAIPTAKAPPAQAHKGIQDKKPQDQREKPLASDIGVGESDYAGIKLTKKEKELQEQEENLRVAEIIQQSRMQSEDLQEKAWDSYKEWKSLSPDEIKQRFQKYAKVFYRSYSPVDGSYKGTQESDKAINHFLDNDFGYYRIHNFLSQWSPLGLMYEKDELHGVEAVYQKLDVLFRHCIENLRANKNAVDAMSKAVEAGESSVRKHSFEVLSSKHQKSVIAVNNFIKEITHHTRRLVKEDPKRGKSESYLSDIRSELQKVNKTVMDIRIKLRLYGIFQDIPQEQPPLYTIISGSEKILQGDYTFPPLSSLDVQSKFDSSYSKLFEIFYGDWTNNAIKEERYWTIYAFERSLKNQAHLNAEVERLSGLAQQPSDSTADLKELQTQLSRAKKYKESNDERIVSFIRSEFEREIKELKSVIEADAKENPNPNKNQKKLQKTREKLVAQLSSRLKELNIDNAYGLWNEYKEDFKASFEYPLGTYEPAILGAMKDMDRLHPIYSVSKTIQKAGGDPSLMMDYEKVEPSDVMAGLPDDLAKRFKALLSWKGWHQLTPAPKISTPSFEVSSYVNPKRMHADTESDIYFEEFKRSLSSWEDEPRIEVERDATLPRLAKDDGSKEDEYEGGANERYVCIPSMDTSESFNSTMGKKRRIFKVVVRVINTADLEVGILGFPIVPVEELRGKPKTGEFEVLVPSDASLNPEIIIRQKTGGYFCLTSITAHTQFEGERYEHRHG